MIGRSLRHRRLPKADWRLLAILCQKLPGSYRPTCGHHVGLTFCGHDRPDRLIYSSAFVDRYLLRSESNFGLPGDDPGFRHTRSDRSAWCSHTSWASLVRAPDGLFWRLRAKAVRPLPTHFQSFGPERLDSATAGQLSPQFCQTRNF